LQRSWCVQSFPSTLSPLIRRHLAIPSVVILGVVCAITTWRAAFLLALGPVLLLYVVLVAIVVEPSTPPKVGRNQACHCGRRRKYKHCCLERDASVLRSERIRRDMARRNRANGVHARIQPANRGLSRFARRAPD